MAQTKRTITCTGHRSCVVTLEPSGDEFLLRVGQTMEIRAEEEEPSQEIAVDVNGSCYAVHLPSGGALIYVNGQPVATTNVRSLSDVIEAELAKLPVSNVDFEFSEEFIAYLQTLEMEDEFPLNVSGKLGVLEHASQATLELVKLQSQSKTHARFVAAVCRRILARGTVFVEAPPSEFSSNLWSAAISDLRLGAAPKSIRRLLASSCIYDESIAEAVGEWSDQREAKSAARQEEHTDAEEN